MDLITANCVNVEFYSIEASSLALYFVGLFIFKLLPLVHYVRLEDDFIGIAENPSTLCNYYTVKYTVSRVWACDFFHGMALSKYTTYLSCGKLMPYVI
jgi:hypothetical protein